MPNRLARERSPYLLQHANNPVDWYAWGSEAFEAARSADKPIFLSIGYSTCHWCHVMEHESFEDAAMAKILNDHFISIKVDREERPDVDRVYMTFVQATTGAGGWPMSVWLTPDLKPFIGGTYFPPTSRWGRPGFPDILMQIAKAWGEDRGRILRSADTMVERLREATGADAAADRAPVAGRDALDQGIASAAQSFDARHGGFGGAPKFPRPSELLFLLIAGAVTGNPRGRAMAAETLRAMAMGGIHDHVGGGFHRYSVDAEWRVPHFEKMLYDQAQIVLACLECAQAMGDSFYAGVAENTLDYVLRDLTAPDGAFYSAEDADSEKSGESGGSGESEKAEGAFYVWTGAEIDAMFGDDAAIVRRRFGIQDAGNALADPQGEFRGQNILYIEQSIDDIAARTGRSVDDVMGVLVRARQKMMEERDTRPRPHRDDKVIAAWNGLMIAAFARAARVLVDSPERARWEDAARRAAVAVRAHLWRATERRLLRRYRDGESAIDGFCEDYACVAFGLIELFQATGEIEWLDWALDLTAQQTTLFFDERDGGWFSTTGQDSSVLLRLKEDYDGAEPAAASVAVRNLLVLGHLVSDDSLVDRAGRTFERYGAGLTNVVRVMPFMVSNLALWHATFAQIVIAGPRDADDTRALLRVAAERYLPAAVTIPFDPARDHAAFSARLPWVAAMTARDGAATAYVCADFACQAPVTSPADLRKQLEDAAAARPSLY
jgi:uncharacterized protein